MMYGVAGQWNMEMSIGGKPYAANTTNIKELNWFETIHQNLPSLNLTFIDYDGTFSGISASGDGVPIDITLGDGDKYGQTAAQFTIIGQPQFSHGTGYNLIKLNAVLNNLPYMRSIATGLMEGTSNTVLGQLASNAGLSFLGDATADAMVWLPSNKTIASFVRDVAARGWVGEGSCMVTAVTDQKELLYRNIMSPQGNGEVFGIGAPIEILDWSATSKALVANNNRGYGATSVGFDMEGNVKRLNKLTFNMFSGFLSMAQTTVDSLGTLGGRIDSVVRSAGNTHENYEAAKHQNARLRDTFSTDLNVLIDKTSRSKLLDLVNAIPQSYSKPEPSREVTGPYILTARTKTLVKGAYQERLTLTSQGSY